MRYNLNFFVMLVLICTLFNAFLTSCTNKDKTDCESSENIDSSRNGYVNFAMDFSILSEYTGIYFPEGSELLEAYAPKPAASENNCVNYLDLFEVGVYAKVSVEKDQINELFSRISEDCRVIQENSSQPFFTVGPFSVGEIPSGKLLKYYVIGYSPEVDGMDEYMHEYMMILTRVFVYDCGEMYNVFLGSYKTYRR